MNIILDKGAYMPERAHDTDEWFNVTCPVCGKKFHLKPSVIKRFKTHYCSKSCHNMAKREYMKGEKNHQYGLRGSKNASWKGTTRKLTGYGYVMVREVGHPFADEQGWVFEHRLIAEKYFLNDENSVLIKGKRYLSPKYQVHHKNFDRTDNRPENLSVMTREEHKRLHNMLNPNERNELGQFKKDEPSIIKVKKVTKTAIFPERKSIGAAGYDLCVDCDKEFTIPPHETAIVWSGLAFEIPKGYFGAIYARSGMSTREGIRPATCVSVIDSDYRGNVGLPLHNDTDEPKIIAPYDRVAQIIFQKALIVELNLVERLEETERGDGGFGSTGR